MCEHIYGQANKLFDYDVTTRCVTVSPSGASISHRTADPVSSQSLTKKAVATNYTKDANVVLVYACLTNDKFHFIHAKS